MIVRETISTFHMTAQHDHALMSEEIARQFSEDLFLSNDYREEAYIAIREHDRAWICLDQTPIWNDQKHVPYSFMDYPLSPKLVMYTKGIDEVEMINQYAGLLCSIHFSSFVDIRDSRKSECIQFIEHEKNRQKRLNKQLNYPKKEAINRHFQLLQLADALSLYICLNEPGATKSDEYPWFVDGFNPSINGKKFVAKWKNQSEIKITPYPFADEFSITYQSKYVSKSLRENKGIDFAYHHTNFTNSKIKFVK